MQLAEVFDKTQAPAPPPRPKRRRWLLWLFALVAFGSALIVHGPGVTQVPSQTAFVVTNDVGLALLGPPARVSRRSAGLAFWVPIVQHGWRMSLRTQRPDPVAFSARTADGLPFPLRKAQVTYRIDPQAADRAFLAFGHRPRRWDLAVRGELAVAWSAVIGEHTSTALASMSAEALVARVHQTLTAQLAPSGVIVETVTRAQWQAPRRIDAGLSRRSAARQALEVARAEAAKAITDGAEADAATHARWATERAALDAILEAELEAARMQTTADLDEARRDAESAIIGARSTRATLFTRAEVLQTVAPSQARALAARTAALTEHGGRLLDEAILQHVLPRIDGRAPPPADDAATGGP